MKVTLLTTLSLVLVSGACSPGTVDATPSVADIVDGDTVIVDFAGRRDTIRLIGIDTPETVAPDRPVECHGPEATEATRSLLPIGTEVDVIIGEEPRDRYERLLAYVFRRDDGLFVNAELLAVGAADTLSYAPNTAFESRFERLASAARSIGAGMWSHCPAEEN